MAEHEREQAPEPATETTGSAGGERASSGAQQVSAMFARGGTPAPAEVAGVIDAHPEERDAILKNLHASVGNSYVQQVVGTKRSTADNAAVDQLLRRLGIETEATKGTNGSHEVTQSHAPPAPVTDDEIEALSPRLHALFEAKLTAGIDQTLVTAIKTAGGMVPFMKDMAAGKTIAGVNEAAFVKMWNVSADEAWLKDKFRAVSPSMHEWIPSNQVEAVVEKAKTAPGGPAWIDLQNELRSPTNQVIFSPAKSSHDVDEAGKDSLVLHGHVGAIYLRGVMQTKDEAKFHDELRAAFASTTDLGKAVDLLKAVMVEWMWKGDTLPKPLDPDLENSVKQPIDEKALLADRAEHFADMSKLFDDLKVKYGGHTPKPKH